ncbi:MAG: CaiB/BaiF CoA transferase family protein [Flavobacteriales bacterium]
MSSTLESIRVLELASVLAGPLAATALAEMGAHVTKVERPPSGDVTRSWKTAGESTHVETSSYYECANGNKSIAWKDLNSDEGRDWLEKQLADHDVLLDNFKSADLQKFNLDPEEVAKRHPHLIRVRLVGFCSEPDRLAYDVVVQAETGFMHMNGHKEQPPVRMPVALMDVLASHQIRSAVLEGLLGRAEGKTGFFAEVSLEASGITALVNQATNYLVAGNIPERNGGLHPNIAPYGEVLPCRDGHLVLAVGNDRQFKSLCAVLGKPKWAEDELYATNQQRVLNRARMMHQLEQASIEFFKEQLKEELQIAGVPSGVVRSIDEVFQSGSEANNWTTENASGARRPLAVAYRVKHF